MIHDVNGHFVVSRRSMWRPGSFASRKAALYARWFSDEQLQALQTRAIRLRGAGADVHRDEMRDYRAHLRMLAAPSRAEIRKFIQGAWTLDVRRVRTFIRGTHRRGRGRLLVRDRELQD